MVWANSTWSTPASRGSSAMPALRQLFGLVEDRRPGQPQCVAVLAGRAVGDRQDQPPPRRVLQHSTEERRHGRGVGIRRPRPGEIGGHRHQHLIERAPLLAVKQGRHQFGAGAKTPCTARACRLRPPRPPPPCSARVVGNRRARSWRRPAAAHAALHAVGAARTCAAAGVGSRRQYYATVVFVGRNCYGGVVFRGKQR